MLADTMPSCDGAGSNDLIGRNVLQSMTCMTPDEYERRHALNAWTGRSDLVGLKQMLVVLIRRAVLAHGRNEIGWHLVKRPVNVPPRPVARALTWMVNVLGVLKCEEETVPAVQSHVNNILRRRALEHSAG